MAHAQLRQFVRQVLREGRKSPTEVARQALENYLHGSAITKFDAEEDPAHVGTVAVRLTTIDSEGEPIDFLVRNCDNEPDPNSDVEETEFPSWPPTRGGRGGPMKMGRF